MTFWTSAEAQISCFVSQDPGIAKLQLLAARDANAAMPIVESGLKAAQGAAKPDPNRIAQYYVLLAQVYTILELDYDARDAAQAGLNLVPDVKNPIHPELLSAYAENVYDHDGIGKAITSVETARARLVPDSVAESCLRITLGTLQYRGNFADLAIVNLMHAYQSGAAQGRLVQRMLAASALSFVMRDMGDYNQALELNSEVIEWNTAQKASLQLSVSRYLRGAILNEVQQFRPAIEEFKKARQLSVELEDTQGIAFADMDLCDLHIKIGQFAEARKRCENALQTFSASNSRDVLKRTRASLANVDLNEGNPALALKTLNELLQNGASDMQPRQVAPLYRLRARANAALGNHRESYADLEEYLKRTSAADDARRVRQAATLRARFETDRQLARNAQLNRELVEAQRRQREQKAWTWIALATGAIVITLLTMHLFSIRRHRRQLAVFANIDSLTGLPNRRHAYELASQVLAESISSQTPLTVAVVDLDHFKSINDHCGHAGGDRVLQNFAAVCREAIRDTDVLGRWGGEEFLLVMPGATLDVALIALERLRELSRRIEIPANDVGLSVGLSAGLATLDASARTLDDLIARADAALYRAKDEGRDLVRIDADSYATASSGVRKALR